MSLNGAISTTFGSNRTSFTMSGRCVYMIDMMIVLMQTDLPEPVVPAIRQWGIFGEVGDERLAAGVLAEEERDRHLLQSAPGASLHQLLEADLFLLRRSALRCRRCSCRGSARRCGRSRPSATRWMSFDSARDRAAP